MGGGRIPAVGGTAGRYSGSTSRAKRFAVLTGVFSRLGLPVLSGAFLIFLLLVFLVFVFLVFVFLVSFLMLLRSMWLILLLLRR